MNMSVTDIRNFLHKHQPKVFWQCSSYMLKDLRRMLNDGRLPVVQPGSAVAPETLLGVPIQVDDALVGQHLELCVTVLPGSGIDRYKMPTPCECKAFKLEYSLRPLLPDEAPCAFPALVCTECGRPSDIYKVSRV